MPAVDAPATLALVGAAYVVLVHIGFRALERRRALVGIPTSAAGGVHIGLNRVRGQARPTAEALVAPLTGTACAGWAYRVDDEWRRDSIVRWRRRRRWRVAAEESSEADFDLADESGAIRVRVAGATITGSRTFVRMLHEGDPDFLAVAPPGDRRGATGRRRITELVIPLDAPTTVVGTARLRADIARPELAWDDTDRRLMISSIGIGVSAARQVVTAALLLLGAVAALAIAPVVIRPSDTEYWQAVDESGAWIPLLLAAALVVAGGYWLRYVYNDLVGLRERVGRAASLVEVELQRRHDLLPALADVVAGAGSHEREVMVGVASADDGEAIRALTVVAEANPTLKVDENYRQVQASIVDTEDRLSLARAFYNDSVTLYNDRLGELPAALVARLFRMDAAALYRSDQSGRTDS